MKGSQVDYMNLELEMPKELEKNHTNIKIGKQQILEKTILKTVKGTTRGDQNGTFKRERIYRHKQLSISRIPRT